MENSRDEQEELPEKEQPAQAKQRVSFMPASPSRSRSGWRVQQSINDATERRMLSLFSSLEIEDPINEGRPGFTFGRREERKPRTFSLVPAEFLAKARRRPPINPQPTASGFSSWIYSLYGSATGKEEDRARGKEVEQHVLDRRRAIYQCVDNQYLRRIISNWALIHNGIEQPEDRPIDYLTVDHLRVGGEPLRVSPDLMYHNRLLSKVLIVEIKHSNMLVPTNLWPNVWAQLWCYSQVDIARKAHSVCVVGEVWCDEWRRVARGEPNECDITLRASVKRDPRMPSYDRFFRELFEVYSGLRVKGDAVRS